MLKQLRKPVFAVVFVEALEVMPQSDGRGIGGGISNDLQPLSRGAQRVDCAGGGYRPSTLNVVGKHGESSFVKLPK